MPDPEPLGPDSENVDEALEEQLRAERKLMRAILVGTLIGAVLGAGVWALIVTVALANDSYWRDIPPVMMGGAVGLLAGGFYGAWAGTIIGFKDLEEAEHHARRRLR